MDNRYLFRGIRVDNGEWVVGQHVYDAVSGKHYIVTEFIASYYVSDLDKVVAFEVVPETIGQCTGLPAAKSYRGESELDRLVFKDDLLKDEENFIWVVEQNIELYGQTGFFRHCDSLMAFEPLRKEDMKFFEIIGNIHQHKHLLESGD